jgi:mannan endo-1,4-beta-mannosidase
MVTNFNPAQLSSWGDRIFNGANGIRATAREATIYSGGTTDNQAPTTPGAPTASSVTSGGATLSWSRSTDNVGVTGYDILRASGSSGGTFTSVGSSATTSFAATGLSPSSTYRFTVRARDAAGNTSASSSPVTVTTSAGPVTGPCKVTYQASNWGGGNGFTGNVTIANTGTSAVDGWTLKFAFPSGQQVSQGWGATWSQSGATVSAVALDYNRTIPSGASVGVGFNGTFNGTNPTVTAFTLNDVACSTS